MTPSRAIALNALGLYAIALVLSGAFVAQFMWNELPCPLCQLQRVMFAMLAVGPMLNIRFGPRPGHYALTILTAVLGVVVAGRQVALHIMPNDPGYGSELLGLHFYTWAAIAFAIAIIAVACVMLFERQFITERALPAISYSPFVRISIWLVILLTAGNAVSSLIECGFGACDDNPTIYELLKRF